jgi:hypothetical protein
MIKPHAIKHVLGVVREPLPFRLRGLSYPALIGSNMKQTTLEKIACGLFLALGTSVLLVTLYFFVKGILYP